MLWATSYTRPICRFSQERLKTCSNASRACHIRSWRLHQAKLAAAHIVGLCRRQAAVSFGVLNVAVGSQAALFQEADASAHKLPQLFGGEVILAILPDAGGDIPVELVDKPGVDRLDVALVQVGANE